MGVSSVRKYWYRKPGRHSVRRAPAICEGFEAGVAVALNQAGNPHESGSAPVDEIGLMIRIGQTLGAAGLPVSKLDHEDTTVRPLIPPLTILTMDKLHAALIQVVLHGGGALNWDIRQPLAAIEQIRLTVVNQPSRSTRHLPAAVPSGLFGPSGVIPLTWFGQSLVQSRFLSQR